MQFATGERDIEIERMKTTLIALNGKLSVMTDIEKEVQDHRGYLVTNETKRTELQVHITELGQKLRVDTDAHDEKHKRNSYDIEALRVEI